MNGIIVVDKPAGLTSRDVVNRVGKIFNTKKVGHTGTLDPIATGVLVICVNKATKLVDYLTCSDKEYVAEVILGIETDTLDTDGIILRDNKSIISKEEIIFALNKFKGNYLQQVPIYSAVKINGKKLYEYARNNIKVTLPKREVEIYDIALIGDIEYIDNKTKFKFSCHVSKGTYIRSLIRDIASSLNTVGVMTSLRRTKQGSFKIDDALKLDNISIDNLISIKDVLQCKCIKLDDNLRKKVMNGAIINNIYDTNKVLFMENNKEIALYKSCLDDNKLMKIDKMF